MRGAMSGLKATAVMSTVFALHPDATVPPKVITDNLFRAVGLRPVPGPWLPAHVAFGITLGALRAAIDAPPIAFAFSVWAAGYGASLPALGLYPPLTRDHRRRAAASLVSHLVFGAALRGRLPSRHGFSKGARVRLGQVCCRKPLTGGRETWTTSICTDGSSRTSSRAARPAKSTRCSR